MAVKSTKFRGVEITLFVGGAFLGWLSIYILGTGITAPRYIMGWFGVALMFASFFYGAYNGN